MRGAGAAATVAAAGLLALGGAVGGCTTTVAGHGAPAAAGLTSPTARSGVPGPGLPSLPLPSGGGADPNPEIPDSPCDVLDKNQLRQQFGQDVDIQSQLDTCKITLSDGSFLAFNAYAALTLDYEKHQEPGRSVTIADRPAYLAQHDHYIVVGRSKNPADRGIVTCYVGFSGSSQINGIQVATQLLEKLMPHYVY